MRSQRNTDAPLTDPSQDLTTNRSTDRSIHQQSPAQPAAEVTPIHDTAAPSPIDWKRLLADFLGSDPRAAAAAAHAFSGVIEGKLYALGAYQRRQTCEDIMHDVLLALFEHGATVEQPAAWVRRATFNAYIDTIRRETLRPSRMWLLASTLTAARPEAMLEDSVVTKDELDELHRALSKLPARLRSVVETVYPIDPEREPCSLADAAGSMQIEVHTLKNWLRRAIQELGREMRRQRRLGRFMLTPAPTASPSRTRRSAAP